MKTCEMTVSAPEFPDSKTRIVYFKCGKPAKFKVPHPSMQVEFVCGIHARSLNKMYERTGNPDRCIALKGENDG